MLMLAPMMPHLAEECWQALGHESLVAETPWPEVEPDLLQVDTVLLPVQVNGKKRAELTIAVDARRRRWRRRRLRSSPIQRFLEGPPAAARRRRAEPDRQCRRLSAVSRSALSRSPRCSALAGCQVRPLYATDRVRGRAAGRPSGDRRAGADNARRAGLPQRAALRAARRRRSAPTPRYGLIYRMTIREQEHRRSSAAPARRTSTS